MKEKFENVEIIDGEEIVTLYDDDDNATEFYEIAVVEYEGDFYALLQPVEELEGVEEGDVLIFRVEEEEEGNDRFMNVEDENVLNAVFEEFMRAVADHECGCGCDDCDGHCHDEDEE